MTRQKQNYVPSTPSWMIFIVKCFYYHYWCHFNYLIVRSKVTSVILQIWDGGRLLQVLYGHHQTLILSDRLGKCLNRYNCCTTAPALYLQELHQYSSCTCMILECICTQENKKYTIWIKDGIILKCVIPCSIWANVLGLYSSIKHLLRVLPQAPYFPPVALSEVHHHCLIGLSLLLQYHFCSTHPALSV